MCMEYESLAAAVADVSGAEITEEVKRLVEQHMEPEMVRGGEKLPEKDHMISYLTVIVLLRETPDPDTVQAVRRFRFTRSYLFTLRGRAETHLILADLGKEQIFTNRDAARHRKIYEDIFREVLGNWQPEILEKIPLSYRCNCSRERVERALISISAKDLRELIEEDKTIEVACQFCDKKYSFTVDDLKELGRRKLMGRVNVVDKN